MSNFEDPFDFRNGWDYYEFTICSHYLSALINSDSLGLTDEEDKEFTQWENDAIRLVIDAQTFHWDCDNDSYFGKDEVSGLMADVVNIRLVFKKGEV